MRIQTITLSYPSDAHMECIIAEEVVKLKHFCVKVGIDWERKVAEVIDPEDRTTPSEFQTEM